jgi:hypothetical protein
MVEITEISVFVAAVGVFVGIVYYILEMRHQIKVRKADLLIRLYSAINSKEIADPAWNVSRLQVNDYKDYVKQYGSFLSENPMHRDVVKILGIYDLIGSLLYKKLIDPELAYNILGLGHTKMLYEQLKPIISGIRKETNEPGAYSGFDYLVNELTRIEPQLKKTTALMQNSCEKT